MLKRCLCIALLILLSPPLLAAEVKVAVASNFAAPMKTIADSFQRSTGHRTTLSYGASGQFFAQISQGAPFEVFLSADQAKPEALERASQVVSGSRFTYALGTLALWSADATRIDGTASALTSSNYNRLAIANPRLAPYGQAAMDVLSALDLKPESLVQGENIAQTFQFVASGNADLGFVALSQIQDGGQLAHGSAWLVPRELYRPIRQDAVLLINGRDNPAASALLDFLKSDKAQEIIIRYGYLPAGDNISDSAAGVQP